MKRYKTIDDLHAYIERQARQTIKLYYSDWKNYDRPKLMDATGKRTTAYIIFRECGSYFFTEKRAKESETARAILEYYTTDKSAKYYKIDLYALTAERIPAGIPEEVKKGVKTA